MKEDEWYPLAGYAGKFFGGLFSFSCAALLAIFAEILCALCFNYREESTSNIGTPLDMYYRKIRAYEWIKAEMLSDVKDFAELSTTREVRAKAIPDPARHNIISKPMDIKQRH